MPGCANAVSFMSSQRVISVAPRTRFVAVTLSLPAASKLTCQPPESERVSMETGSERRKPTSNIRSDVSVSPTG